MYVEATRNAVTDKNERGTLNVNVHTQILPVAVGLVVYGLVRGFINSIFTNFGFPFA